MGFLKKNLGKIVGGLTGGVGGALMGHFFMDAQGNKVPVPAAWSGVEREVYGDNLEAYRQGQDTHTRAQRGLAAGYSGVDWAAPVDDPKTKGIDESKDRAGGAPGSMEYDLGKQTGARVKAAMSGSLAANPAVMKAFERRRQQMLEEAARRGQATTGTVMRDRLDKYDMERTLTEEMFKYGILNEFDAANLAGTNGMAMHAAANPYGLAAALGTERAMGPAGSLVMGMEAERRGQKNQYNTAVYNQKEAERAQLMQLVGAGVGAAGTVLGGAAGSKAGGLVPGQTPNLLPGQVYGYNAGGM